MKKDILIKPIISEKSEILSDSRNQFSFVVNKKANKIEIKKAVEKEFSVGVVAVNTMIVAPKSKTRNTRSGMIKGRTAAYKKAIVTLNEGETIDFFGEE